ncbi:MAG TPA: 2-hydroxyacyl-CoA dehydratase family protein [Candidatus Anoxymicrobiaceae bacterium]|jgi:benzoyl-CoA reductase/2-hydroxyglutaryl-CoA dehydratase subunit BcrC/BadD/HgdB
MAREKTRAGKHLSELLMNAYMGIHGRAAEGALVVWGAIVVPPELFLGFENVVFCVPESHAALCAGKGVGADQCLKAEALGYSMDLCSYARIDIGCLSDGYKDSPTFGLPRPDLLVSDNNNCSLLVKWFDVHRRAMGVPHFILDVPFCYGPQQEKDLAYILSQFRDLIATVEELTGETFDEDRFRQAALYTAEGVRQWKRFVSFAKHRPSGLTVFDSFVQMAPLFTSRGTPEFAEHYKLLADEVAERVAAGIFPVPQEKYRLLWDNIAPWHQLRKMSERLAALGANIVAAPYTSCIGSLEGSFAPFEMDEDADPLWYLARSQNHSVCPMGMDLRLAALGSAIEEVGIDGVVFASNRSCKVFSVMQMDEQRLIGEKYGLPTVMIDVDHADVRKFSEESAYLRLEALLENIEAGRAGG